MQPEPKGPQTISLTFALCQCQALAAGQVSDEMREYFTDAVAALQSTQADCVKRPRKRRAA